MRIYPHRVTVTAKFALSAITVRFLRSKSDEQSCLLSELEVYTYVGVPQEGNLFAYFKCEKKGGQLVRLFWE